MKHAILIFRIIMIEIIKNCDEFHLEYNEKYDIYFYSIFALNRVVIAMNNGIK